MANVLVVDDNADTCRVLSAFLTRAGHHATCTPSVSLAMEKIDEQTPDLIITDLMMPYQSGYDLLRMVRKNPRMMLYTNAVVVRMRASWASLRASTRPHSDNRCC